MMTKMDMKKVITVFNRICPRYTNVKISPMKYKKQKIKIEMAV
jgi:hypothetical protein